jgi:hypothetical protein
VLESKRIKGIYLALLSPTLSSHKRHGKRGGFFEKVTFYFLFFK